ncbi:hypothetical protein AMATHDRAFT_59071 [Amanita thiersii Skay4041]|uniref:Uncharacterized protein n=1 Tax=Amanita thiersii Skay4041 TaxID=703135 RepID=A0A2A9NSY0_9AGAR|nr:hypothetical protein AMATHDRAFT_59071 [Amanita thiersii Skay4041]
MASLKRKLSELYDSDDDEPGYGKQILPVADLPDDFDGLPADGLQYLFTVRRETRSLPYVTRVDNPYAVADNTVSPAIELEPSHPALPSPEWRAVHQKRFRNFRKNFSQPTIHVEYTPTSTNRRIMPDKKERDLWWAFLSGKPESEWNPPKKSKASKLTQKTKSYDTQSVPTDEEPTLPYDPPTPGDIYKTTTSSKAANTSSASVETKGREPLPSLLKLIDERMALHLLMYFAHWFSLYLDAPQASAYHPTESHARWIFSLLACVEDRVSGDDIAMLRSLARACLAILKRLLGRGEESEHIKDRTKNDYIRESSCWIIISTVVDIWGQHDLWMDAEKMLQCTVVNQ